MSDEPTTVASFVLALKAGFQAHLLTVPEFADSKVYLVHPGKDVVLKDDCVLIRARIHGDQEYVNNVRKRDEKPEIPGFVQAYGTHPSDTEAAFELALVKAHRFLGELITYLRDNTPMVGQQTLTAKVTSYDYLPSPADEGGWFCRVEYTVGYEARVR